MPITQLSLPTRRLLQHTPHIPSFEAAVVSCLPEAHALRITVHPTALRFEITLPPLPLPVLQRAIRSISTVASVLICCQRTQRHFRNGVLLNEQSCGDTCSIAVWELFNNLPVRRRIEAAREEGDMLEACRRLVVQVAFANPSAKVVLCAPNHLVMLDTKGMSPDVIGAVWGLTNVEWKKFSLTNKICNAHGFVSCSGVGNDSMIVLGINGVPCREDRMLKPLITAWRSVVDSTRFPLFVINVDTNIPVERLQPVLSAAIINLFSGQEQKRVSTSSRKRRRKSNNVDRFADVSLPMARRKPLPMGRVSIGRTTIVKEESFRNFLPKWRNACMPVAARAPDMDAHFGCKGVSVTRECLRTCRVVGQVDCKFILISDSKGVYAVDQHAASERYLYELYLRKLSRGVKGRILTDPVQLSLTRVQKDIVERHGQQLGVYGWKIVDMEMMEAPYLAVLDMTLDSGHYLKTFLDSIVQGGRWKSTPKPFVNAAALVACHKAVRFGDELTREMCGNVVSSLAECDNPFSCAHGRPAVAPLVVFDEAER